MPNLNLLHLLQKFTLFAALYSSVQECDATGDAMKNLCWVHK